jgi:hypothetical protein
MFVKYPPLLGMEPKMSEAGISVLAKPPPPPQYWNNLDNILIKRN